MNEIRAHDSEKCTYLRDLGERIQERDAVPRPDEPLVHEHVLLGVSDFRGRK